jgi:GNAT superfamily N-acetyltransferase
MPELVLSKAEECRPLRRAVLRPHQGPEACVYEGDDDTRTLHLLAKEGKQVLGVISVYHDPRGEVGSEVWRIRGLAVDPEHRGQGLGRMLLAAVQAVVEKRGGGLWANVREGAVDFYAAHGFERQGGPFEVPDLGPHLVMTWRPAP